MHTTLQLLGAMLKVGHGWGVQRGQKSPQFSIAPTGIDLVYHEQITRLVRGTAAGSSRDAVKEMKIRESGQVVGVEVDPLPLGHVERYMTSMGC